MRTLIFDTETTGMLDWRRLDCLDRQPYIVQLAAALYDERELKSHLSLIIMPRDQRGDLISIPDEVAAIHGITNQMTDHVGVTCYSTLRLFSLMANSADRVVAHNIDFDRAMLYTEFMREENDFPSHIAALPHVCTMRSSTPACKIPGLPGRYKWPKLIEAHRHFLGEDFEGAHDAMADVGACARVLWALEDGGHELVVRTYGD